MSMEQNKLAIRHSTIDDLPKMLEIYTYARRFMAEHGNARQWGPTNWPPEELLKKDIEKGNSYVCEADGRVVATFCFLSGPHIEQNYDEITEGQWPSVVRFGEQGNTYGVVHRLAGDGSEKGLGAYCLNWAYEQIPHLRVDTHPDNVVMQNLLKKLGFVACGRIYVAQDNDPRIAFEKFEGISNGGNQGE